MSEAGEATDKHSDNFYHRFLLHYHHYLFYFCFNCAIDFANWWGFNHPHKCSLLVLALNLHVSFLPSGCPGFYHLTPWIIHLVFICIFTLKVFIDCNHVSIDTFLKTILFSSLIFSSDVYRLYTSCYFTCPVHVLFFVLSVYTKALPKPWTPRFHCLCHKSIFLLETATQTEEKFYHMLKSTLKNAAWGFDWLTHCTLIIFLTIWPSPKGLKSDHFPLLQ